MQHYQCKLKHKDGATDTIWVPEAWAVKGKVLKRKINGEWIDGWLVVEVYHVGVASAVIAGRARDYKNHRKATDI